MYQGHQATLMHARDQHNTHVQPCSPEPVPQPGSPEPVPPPGFPEPIPQRGSPERVPQRAAGHCRTALAAGPESIATARDFTTAALRGWRLDMLVRDAVMVASELVTNAIRHGTRGASRAVAVPEEMTAPHIGLAWCRQASRLVCVVTDYNTEPPLLVPAGPDAESGRGLQIVHAVATAWGWTLLNAEEKAVWAAFRLPAPEPSALPRGPERAHRSLTPRLVP